jgi:diguanylate cyclase (GGDEF)-like protein
LARRGTPASCVDCDLKGRGLGVRLGLSPAELWEWDWRSAEGPAELKDGTLLWALDPYRRAPDGEDLAGLLERVLSEIRGPAVLDLGTGPDAWWFRLGVRHADALVWVVRADPLLLARALACWRDREPAGVPELLVLWGEGSPEEASALFSLECVQVKGPEDRHGLRELLSALEAIPARGTPVVLLVGFRRAPVLDGFEAVSFRTGYEAAAWLEENAPTAAVLSGDMPDLLPFLRALREDPRLSRVPVGVAGGGPEALEAGADDVLFEVSAEAVELLLAKGRRLREAREEAETDPLTGLPNRRAGEKMLDALARRCRERGEHLSVAVLDLDDFKKINDVHGHPAGDAVLRTFAEFLRANLRSADLACRWGGEEFLLAFPNTPVSGAVRACENLLGKWRAKSVSHGGAALSCTFSAGVAPCPGFPADAAAEADRALYRAKAEGKGRVLAAGRAEAARAG